MMNYKYLTLFIPLFVFFSPCFAQSQNLGVFDSANDIGKPKLRGSAFYDVENQVYKLKGAGSQIGLNKDEFYFLSSRMQGDFIVTANFEFADPIGKDPRRKLGWMVRESLEEDAVHFTSTIQGDGLTMATWREIRGSYMRNLKD
jgi:hypothetical protein